jgi:hypothetical protein
MYTFGRRKKNIKIHLYRVTILLLLSILIAVPGVIYLNSRPNKKAEIKNISEKNVVFDPVKSDQNIKVQTDLYSMELPNDWKQISTNKDPRYSSIEWQWNAKTKNRTLEIFVDRYPTNMPLNKIMPVTVQSNSFTPDSESDNCSKFTNKISDANLKVPSKWQDVPFLCDLDNTVDNIVGVGTINEGVYITLNSPTKGSHKYMFIYTDRSIPENDDPLKTALRTFAVK